MACFLPFVPRHIRLGSGAVARKKRGKYGKLISEYRPFFARGLVCRFTFSSYLHARSRRGRLESDRRKRRRKEGFWHLAINLGENKEGRGKDEKEER